MVIGDLFTVSSIGLLQSCADSGAQQGEVWSFFWITNNLHIRCLGGSERSRWQRKGSNAGTVPRGYGSAREKDREVKGDKKKQSLYFPVSMLSEMQDEASRQERPLSWIMQQAWKLSREKIRTYPGVADL